MEPIQIAQVCHMANKGYCEVLGDYSQVDWTAAPDWQKQSTLNGVNAILSGKVNTPEESHKSWLEEKRREGWSYGFIKDVVEKKHPCFIPYSELPEEQRYKDKIFFAIVTALKG